MTKLKDFYPTQWLVVADLNGRSFELIITQVAIEALHEVTTNKDVPKIILAFHGAKRRMILNKTQAFKLAEITGTDEIESWVGHTILVKGGLGSNRKPTLVVDYPTQKPAVAPVTTEANDGTTTEETDNASE